MQGILVRLIMGTIIPYYGVPVASNEGLILDTEFNDFTSLPYMPMTVAILVCRIQLDQELSFTHVMSSSTRSW